MKLNPHLRIWLDSDQGPAFGKGSSELLRLIAEHGALREASHRMGMSYRRAWGRIKAIEDRLGYSLVHKPGRNKAGYELISFDFELLDPFRRHLEEVESAAFNRASQVPPFGAARYS